MRPEGRMRLAYFPLDEAEAQRIARFLRFPAAAAATTSLLDPCCGTGAALGVITASGGTAVRRYGVELDAFRAREAAAALDCVIHGNAFDTHAPVESFSLLYLNPPYDFELGEGKNERMEKLFLEGFFRWLRPGGVLVMVVPHDRIYEMRNVLSPHFKEKSMYRLTEPAAQQYKQAVVFGVRRTHAERGRLGDHAVSQANAKLHELTHGYEAMPALPDAPDRVYDVPAAGPVHLEHRGLPLDLIEDLLEKSPAWLQARRVTHAHERKEFVGRPLTPLHAGHVGLCAVSGLLNGEFGTGESRHVACWEAVKVVDRIEEEGENGETVIREKERFSQRLTLLYADGRYAMLSERPGGGGGPGGGAKRGSDGERAPEGGEAEVRAPEP